MAAGSVAVFWPPPMNTPYLTSFPIFFEALESEGDEPRITDKQFLRTQRKQKLKQELKKLLSINKIVIICEYDSRSLKLAIHTYGTR